MHFIGILIVRSVWSRSLDHGWSVLDALYWYIDCEVRVKSFVRSRVISFRCTLLVCWLWGPCECCVSQGSWSAAWALRARMRAVFGGWRFWTAQMLRIKSVWRPARARSPAVPSRVRRAGPTPKPRRSKSRPQTLNTVSHSSRHFTQNNDYN